MVKCIGWHIELSWGHQSVKKGPVCSHTLPLESYLKEDVKWFGTPSPPWTLRCPCDIFCLCVLCSQGPEMCSHPSEIQSDTPPPPPKMTSKIDEGFRKNCRPAWMIDLWKDWTQPQHLHLLYSRCELGEYCMQDRPRSVTSPQRIRKQDNTRAHETHLPCDKHRAMMTNLVHRINEDIYSSKAGRWCDGLDKKWSGICHCSFKMEVQNIYNQKTEKKKKNSLHHYS